MTSRRKVNSREVRYLQGLCVHCPHRRDCASSRCAECREKATRYMRTVRHAQPQKWRAA